jgi:hypothetical protein
MNGHHQSHDRAAFCILSGANLHGRAFVDSAMIIAELENYTETLA